MTEADANRPVVLTSVPSELVASLLVGRLQNEGIRAEMAGIYTASFRTEAPGEVQILVLCEDEARARELIDQWQHETREPESEELDNLNDPEPRS